MPVQSSSVPSVFQPFDEKRVTSFFGFAEQVLQAQNMIALVRTTHHELPPLLEAESIYLVSYTEEKGEFWTTLSDDTNQKSIRFDLDMPLLGLSFREKKLINSRNHDATSWQNALGTLFHSAVHSLIVCPIVTGIQRPYGLLVAVNKKNGGEFDLANENMLSTSCQLCASIIDHFNNREQIQAQHQKLTEENKVLRQLLENPTPIPLIGSAPKTLEVIKIAQKAATSPVPVLIEGEEGTGKELLAQHIHFQSSRMNGPFVSLNCAVYPQEYLADEIFGKLSDQKTPQATILGKLESVERGTLYLSEIDKMPPPLQERLLHLIQTGEYFPENSPFPKFADIRIIASSIQALEPLTKDGHFNPELYQKLKTIHINLPPLSERKEDILLLADFFLQEACKKTNKRIKGFEPSVLDAFQKHPWEKNIDGLKHHIQQLVALTDQQQWIRTPKLKAGEETRSKGKKAVGSKTTLRDQVQEFERQVIDATLNATSGNKTKTAKLLGLTREGLRIKLKKINGTL